MEEPGTCSGSADPRRENVDPLSDDSGVGFAGKRSQTRPPAPVSPSGTKRNKRKSAEPKRRGEVLQMKRFRWESDSSDQEEPTNIVPEVCPDRPGSSDSGCHSSDPQTDPVWARGALKGTPTVQHADEKFRKSVIQTPAAPPLTRVKPKSATKNNVPQTEPSGSALSSIPGPSEFTEEQQRSRPRNYYKSMSRQRRIEANARERTRVHTISAAFENLRRAVPAYADSQKLSKLAILKIASAYILALACLNNQDYSEEQNRPSLADCVELCTGTIQAEGRARRRNKD